MDKHKKCNYCGEEKPLTEFYESQRGSKCKLCLLEQTRIYKKNRRKDSEFKSKEKLKYQERKIRLWGNILLQHSKSRNIENTLVLNDIFEMYEKQNGLCFWFKIPIIPSLQNKHPQQPSLDRLDRTKGYTKDNVVLTCYSANIGRNESDLDVWRNFVELLINNNTTLIEKKDDLNELLAEIDRIDDRNEYVIYDETLKCYTTKNLNEFFRKNDFGVKNVSSLRKKNKRNVQKGLIILNRTKGEVVNKRIYHLTSPENIEYRLYSLRSFCKLNNLNDSALQRVAKGELNQYKGWTCKYEVITLK